VSQFDVQGGQFSVGFEGVQWMMLQLEIGDLLERPKGLVASTM
jgi:hypothetical protein